MLERRTFFRFCLWGGLALIFVGAGSLFAQENDDTNKEKKEDPEFPPAKLTPQIIRQSENQRHGLVLYPPKTWTRKDPAEGEKEDWLAQFTINEPGRDSVKLDVYYYGNKNADISSAVDTNISSWINEFDQQNLEKKITTGNRSFTFPDAKGHAPAEDRFYILVDLKGTHKETKDARMLAAIVGIQWKEDPKTTKSQSSVYFLKMSGPAKAIDGTVEDSFRQALGTHHKENEPVLKE